MQFTIPHTKRYVETPLAEARDSERSPAVWVHRRARRVFALPASISLMAGGGIAIFIALSVWLQSS